MTDESAAADRRARLTGRAVVLALIVIGLLVSAAYPVRSYLSQRAEIDGLEKQARVLEEANRRVTREIDDLRNPAYIEELARKCLGWVRPGEIGFILIPKRGAARPPTC